MFRGIRVDLLPLEKKHLETIHGWLFEEDIIKSAFFGDPFPNTIETLHERLERQDNRSERVFVIIEKHSGSLIGEVMLYDLDYRNRKAQHAIIIGSKKFRCKGYGSEAIHLSLVYAFDGLNFQRIEANVLEDNYAALRSYEKAGFLREGLRRNAVWSSGTWKNVVLLSSLRVNTARLSGEEQSTRGER